MGSNDTSNAIGICIGCGIIKLKRAILFFGVFVLIGISLQGERVMKTVGKGIVEVDIIILSVSCIVSAALIIASNWKKIPLSVLQVLIGSLAGAGAGSGVLVHYDTLGKILLSWAVSPFIALIFANLLYRGMERALSRYPVFSIERILRGLLLGSSILIAYNTGANSLATILGPAVHAEVLGRYAAFAIGSLFVFLGAYLLSYRVVDTVGKGITALDPFSGFAAQFGAGACVLLFTILACPYRQRIVSLARLAESDWSREWGPSKKSCVQDSAKLDFGACTRLWYLLSDYPPLFFCRVFSLHSHSVSGKVPQYPHQQEEP